MIPIIMSGGSGTRLWPISRSKYPKQFCNFYEKSFMEMTIERLLHYGSPSLLTVNSLSALSEKVLKNYDLDRSHLILEPFGRNTAPAIALLCFDMKRRNLLEEVVGVFPADHLVSKKEKFIEAVDLAIESAKKGHVVTLGIEPHRPATGYGYIEVKDEVLLEQGNLKSYFVKGFREKPNLETAKEFITTQKHFWNAGMFMFQVSHMIKHFETHLPEMWKNVQKIKADNSNIEEVYKTFEKISIDVGIMEKLEAQVCIPCEIGWSDVGAWEEIARIDDESQDSKKENLFEENSKNNYVHVAPNKVVSLIGVEDLIVVDTEDALLLSKKGQSEGIKKLADEMDEKNITQLHEHLFEYRPWGKYEILKDEDHFKLKKITVFPQGKLSYQSHEKRSEHWTVTQGEGVVTLNGDEIALKAGEHIFIPAQAKHRIFNPGALDLEFVEVQVGEYFGEDDIVRYEDSYGRR